MATDLQPFEAIADLERAIADAEANERRAHDAVVQTDTALGSASAARGPVNGKLKRALEHEQLSPIAVPELADAAAEELDKAAAEREELTAGLETEERTLDRAHAALQTRQTGIRGKITAVNLQIKNAEGHLPESHRGELPDLSLSHEELETALDQLVSRLNVAVSAIQKLAGAADDAFEVVRLLIEDESFRRLEPHVADNLRRFQAETLYYFGDIDPAGLRIGSQAAQRRALRHALPLQPAASLYTWLVEYGKRTPLEGSEHVTDQDIGWLPSDLRGPVTALFASRQRVPQESLGTHALMSGRVPECSFG